jgi:hypothetical protein
VLKIDSIERGKKMNNKEALKIVGGLAKPSKMPGWAYGLPAAECKTGSKLAKQEGTTCSGCYALKGCYVFKVVQAAQYRRLESIKDPAWVEAMALLINSKKQKWFRWHDSGDVQDEAHLMKIFEVCRLTPETKHWMPTREAWTKDHLKSKPANLVLRFSMPMVDQAPSKSWPNVSTVSTKDQPWFGATSVHCPAQQQNNECGDCRQCWNPEIQNVTYPKH